MTTWHLNGNEVTDITGTTTTNCTLIVICHREGEKKLKTKPNNKTFNKILPMRQGESPDCTLSTISMSILNITSAFTLRKS